jgi:hypothetical protein
MKADLTRNTFHPLQHFTRVLMQQGRVQLDADWNEQAAILLRYLQTLAADLIGTQGGPADHLGFEIKALPGTPPNDFQIGLGHYYVDGILCEADSTPIAIFPAQEQLTSAGIVFKTDTWTLDGAPLDTYSYAEVFDATPGTSFSAVVVQINADPKQRTLTLTPSPKFGSGSNPKLRRVITYLHQPDYPSPEPLTASTTYQVHLDVWERHITYVEDDSIREVALGGPDTATRAKIVWQVKSVKGNPKPGANNPCDGFNPTDSSFLASLLGANRGRLKAMAKQSTASTDPCTASPDARYRGPENQLYRVEVHKRGPAWDGKLDKDGNPAGNAASAATFKWSRENGSVVFPVAGGGGTNTPTLETLGRDERYGLAENDWVEVQDDDYVLQNLAGNLLQIQSVDRTSMTVTLSGTPDPKVGKDQTQRPLLRRWDQKAGDPAEGGLQLGSDNAALIIEDSSDNWLDLEDGVQIQFQKLGTGQTHVYRTGDYWLIPARTATGEVEWPKEKDSQGNLLPIAMPPDGVTHHYAPLAVITVDEQGKITNAHGCRTEFKVNVALVP